MTTLRLFISTIATTLINIPALLIFAAMYALLLVSAYLFISTREATVRQVLTTYALMILIPALFFIWQSAVINRTRDGEFQWRVILLDALTFFVATIPVLLIAWLLHYLLNKVAVRYPPPILSVLPGAAGPAKPAPLHWPSMLFATVKFVLWGIAFPLASIHLWISVSGGKVRSLFSGGVKSFLGTIGSALARAFSSEPVLIYGLGLFIFFVIPYVILIPVFTVKGNKADFVVFVLRLLISFVFTLIGWVVTLSALVRNSPGPSSQVAAPAVALPTEAAA